MNSLTLKGLRWIEVWTIDEALDSIVILKNILPKDNQDSM